jgi:HAL2 family 3'(2'),5'-bisphosphate nucleotidase
MFDNELKSGLKAVRLAGQLIRFIQQEMTSQDSFSKSDRSPVTVADFLSQALICRILHWDFPDIPIVAEEDSRELKKKQNRQILERIIDLIRNNEIVRGIIEENNLFESIDLGADSPGRLYWTLDPIDGTKGFLRGEQFAVALALIRDGEVAMGILGCPRLILENQEGHGGYLFYAIKNHGAHMQTLNDIPSYRIHASYNLVDPERMRFVESYVSSHSDTRLQKKIADVLNIKRPPLQIDSQVKYGLVASGNAEIYLRIPNPRTPDYKEKIWDHAAGSLIVEESGGLVTDIFGKKLDFSQGKTLKNNSGILATIPKIQNEILSIIKRLKNS